MNVHAFMKSFRTQIDRHPDRDVANTSGAWSSYMAGVFHAMVNELGVSCCCHLGHHDEVPGVGREYLWDLTWYEAHGAYYDLPSVVIEHENQHSDAEFFADFWKVMTAFAPLRVMVGYTGREKLEARISQICRLVDAQGWTYPPNSTDVILLHEYGGGWHHLVRHAGRADFVAYKAPPESVISSGW
jgi:hypothetical protein